MGYSIWEWMRQWEEIPRNWYEEAQDIMSMSESWLVQFIWIGVFAMMAYWLVLAILASRGIILKSQRSRYYNNANLYETVVGTCANPGTHTSVTFEIDGVERTVNCLFLKEPGEETVPVHYRPGTKDLWVEGDTENSLGKQGFWLFFWPFLTLIALSMVGGLVIGITGGSL